MLRRTGIFLFLLALPQLGLAARRSQDPIQALERQQRALFDRAAPAVVYISSGKGFGSGFFVDDAGLILTNAHVVGSAAQVDVVMHDGSRHKGEVVERGADKVDVALVRIPVKKSPLVPMGGLDELRVGSWVASVGHGMGGIWTFNVGMVSNIYPAGSEHPIFQTQIPLNPGNSGGPVLDRQGRVVGVVTAGINESNAINFAIRMDVATRSLSKLGDVGDYLVIEAPAGVPVFVDGEMVGKGPRLSVPVAAGQHEVFAVIKGKMRKRKVSFPKTKRVKLDSP